MISIAPTERGGTTQAGLQLLVFYTDFSAGVRAKQLTDQITLLAGSERKISVQFWKLDSIPKIGPLKGIIARDASAADVLVIASSTPAEEDAFITAWLKSLSAVRSQRRVRGILVGVLGDETKDEAGLDFLLSTLFLFACRAQLDFVLQPAGGKSTSGGEKITDHFKHLIHWKTLVDHSVIFGGVYPKEARDEIEIGFKNI